VLTALEAVNLAVVIDEDTRLELIKRIRPAVPVKGADYRIEEVTGRDVVESVALLVSLVPGHSTIGLVRGSAESAKPQCGQRRSESRTATVCEVARCEDPGSRTMAEAFTGVNARVCLRSPP